MAKILQVLVCDGEVAMEEVEEAVLCSRAGGLVFDPIM